MAERLRGKKYAKPRNVTMTGNDDPIEMLLKGIVLSVADEAEKSKASK